MERRKKGRSDTPDTCKLEPETRFCRGTGVLVGGGGGGRLPTPHPNKMKPCLIFNSIQAYPYSTCRQVEISFLGMPQIAHFQVEK